MQNTFTSSADRLKDIACGSQASNNPVLEVFRLCLTEQICCNMNRVSGKQLQFPGMRKELSGTESGEEAILVSASAVTEVSDPFCLHFLCFQAQIRMENG